MALTLVNQPAAKHAAHNPAIYDYDTNRDRSASHTTVAVSNSGGFVLITKTAHQYVVNDVITITNASAGGEDMEGRCKVTAATANTFTTNIPWVAGYTGDTVDTLVTNDNLRMRVQLKEGATVKGTQWVDYVDYTGTWYFRFDASDILQHLVSPDILDLALSDVESSADQTTAIVYTLSLTCFYDSYDYDGMFEDDTITTTTSGGDPLIGYNVRVPDGGSFSDYVLVKTPAGEFMTNRKHWLMRTGDQFQLSYICDETYTKMRWTIVEQNGTPHSGYTALELMVNSFAIAPVSSLLWNTWGATWATATIQIYTEVATVDTPLGEIITITNPDSCVNDGMWLDYNNAIGGFDSYQFSKREDIDRTGASLYTNTEERTANIDQQPTAELDGYYENNDDMAIYKEMYLAREMYLVEDDERARVNNAGNTQTVRDRNWPLPVMKLRKQKDYIL